MATSASPVSVPANGTADGELLQVKNLKMYFPITQGIILQRQVGWVKAVDDISFTVLAQGQGRIEAVNTFACPSATAHGCSIPEPGPGAGPSGDQDRVRRTFEVTIRVV